jgi:galactokinase/mevalonate kinase-like predicted kinase
VKSTQLKPTQYLLSVPSAMAHIPFPDSAGTAWFLASDPLGGSLGSGGGTVNLLVEAWKATGGVFSFDEWLRESHKLLIHGGGQSRRLPAYGPVGKPFLPIPVIRGELGQRLDQTLLDIQMPVFDSVLNAAPDSYVMAVASGDVLLRFAPLSAPLPEADVLALGMPATPETAQSFGVFFFRRDTPQTLAFFLQKPSPDLIRKLSEDFLFLVDTGFWLLSERAVNVLLDRCGWDKAAQDFPNNRPLPYDLYASFGPAMGTDPAQSDAAIAALSAIALPLAESEFYHLGTGRQMIESVSRLQNRKLEQSGWGGLRPHPDQFVLNAVFDPPIRQAVNHTLWVENSFIPASWQLAQEHILTGVPDNDWNMNLEPRVCLDFVPVGDRDYCIRMYGLDDLFRGAVSDPKTLWLGQSASLWMARRGLSWEEVDIAPGTDLYEAPLFPKLPLSRLHGAFIEWLFQAQPEPNRDHALLWRESQRLSALDLNSAANVIRLFRQREENLRRVLPLMHSRPGRSAFFDLDLSATARLIARTEIALPPALPEGVVPPLTQMQDSMLRAHLSRLRGSVEAKAQEEQAFGWLRNTFLSTRSLVALPGRNILEDQILWGRCPLRFDLAGGWTDTPPYCLQHGGKVLNLAVNLNGQPPVQVFARPTARPELVLRSIDLGLERRIQTYDELDTFARPDSDFALAKAALALAGFLPRFHAEGGKGTLAAQLADWGGGIELSLLAAAPKGSGLGTSSLLAATLLGTLSEFCGLGWDTPALVARTLLLEQLVTTGGGWQDQAGGLFPGVKLLETMPGPEQTVSVRWAPDQLFSPSQAGGQMLLYYTGLTRLAKTILQDIVRGMFLGDAPIMACLRDIGQNAEATYEALQRGSYEALCERVQTSWRLNQALDAGTNPPEVQAILDSVADWLAAAKLTGAGGGGYLLMLAKDEEAAERIRERLTQFPPNPRARFVHFSLSETGLQITRS